VSVIARRTQPASLAHRVLMSIATLLVAVILLKCVLDAAYLVLMRGFFSADPTISAGPGRLALSYLLAAVAGSVVGLDVAMRPGAGNTASLLYLCLVVVPMLTLFAFGEQFTEPEFILAVVACLALVVCVRMAVPAIRPPAAGPVPRYLLLGLMLAMTLYVYGGLLATRGLQRMNFDLAQIYAFREEFRSETFPLANYLIAWQAYVVNMLMLAMAGFRRRWLLVAVVLFLQVALFGMTNQKAFMLAPVAVLGVLIVGRSPLRIAWGIVAGSALVVLVAWGLFLLTDDLMIPAILVRRLFFLPAELHLFYHDYFAGLAHPVVLLSNSVLSAASPYPYHDAIPTLVGWAYLGVETNANAGWLADAFAHFGYGGMVAFSVILAIFLRQLDGAATGVPPALAAAIVVVPAMALVNSGLLTVLLTHGFLLAALVLWVVGGGARSTGEWRNGP